ncbi:hypothetical protein U3C50_004322 [Providencia rettgeri]|nr:hypothetical protein [Providencia rettgeri]EMB3084555.1 hypothetical protein [Providencia rettgeri]MDU7496184.1 hypothetical protein [Providencia rettgeri]HEM8307631.1 hypothetical protein [Providencia rettgeri]
MERLQTIIIICVIAALGFLSSRLIIYWEQNTEYRRINNFIKHCTSPVNHELADGLYRYQCDAGFYTSSLSPEKFKELKDEK